MKLVELVEFYFTCILCECSLYRRFVLLRLFPLVGFAFVRLSNQTEQQKAMVDLNNTQLGAKVIKIRTAQPKETRIYPNYNQVFM